MARNTTDNVPNSVCPLGNADNAIPRYRLPVYPGLTRIDQLLPAVGRWQATIVLGPERLEYKALRKKSRVVSIAHDASERLPWVPALSGVGPLAWRQFVGAGKYRGSLLLALAAPGVSSCLPLIVIDEPMKATLNVVGALAFYSFLLLPSALKFDFRRDIDRIIILKGLPVRPWAVVVGQLATPVLIACGLQLAVLAVNLVIWPTQIRLLLIAFCLLVPMNVLIFALDNLLFLFYPHRLKQEGVEVFLRATLTFSAKGLLFAASVVAIFAWALLAKFIIRMTDLGYLLPGGRNLVFAGGLWVLLLAASVTATYLVVLAYRRFDPCQDTPA